MRIKGTKRQACSDIFLFVSKYGEERTWRAKTHKVEVLDATPNTRGVESNDNKTHGQPKAVNRKKADAKLSRRKMRPRKLQREKQGHTATRTLQSKHRRKGKARAKQAWKTKRLKSKRVCRNETVKNVAGRTDHR